MSSSWLRRSLQPISAERLACYDFHEDFDFDETHSTYSDESGLDSVSSTGVLRSLTSDISAPRIDSYRFSMANLEDSQDVDLDAILGELCALETQYDREIDRAAQNKRASAEQQRTVQHVSRTHVRSSSEGNRGLKLDPGESDSLKGGGEMADGSVRTDSPDNDSAFSDTVSMLSSESSASSGASAVKSHHLHLNLSSTPDAAGRAKAEKIRMALEKMREASVKKLFIKAFTMDGSTKSLLVDEKMICGYVTRLLADKNHVQMDPKWAMVEHIPDLYMERVYEDHELLVENLMLWTRDSKNKLLFVERPEKTHLFTQPERFLLSQSDRHSSSADYDEHSRGLLLDEFFSLNANSIPQVEGPLYLKSESKKGWKKYQFVLRASGLYYFPKEKLKTSRDLVCLAKFDVNQVYHGVGWRKKYKAPTDYCFAIKHPVMQEPKSSKYIKFLCAEDATTLARWMVGIRIAKHGRQLMDNYRLLMDELAQEDLDKLAHARSCSVSSIATSAIPPSSTATTPACSDISGGRHSRASSSSSSGCMSDGGAPSSCENAFDCEFPMGTIKRKPSMKPSLPLTSITRQLKEVGETRDSDCDSSVTCSSPVTYTNTGTLTRRHSRRKSGGTDDGSNSGTLKRQYKGRASGASTPVRERALGSPSLSPSSPICSLSPSSPICPIVSSCMTDSITSLPPLPDSTETEILEADSAYPLPPPPPEMFRSTLSLDSLPPPPPPGEMPASGSELTGSQLSLMSLPPPPPPPVCVPGDSGTVRRRNKTSSVTSPDRTPTQPLSPDATPTHSRLNTPCFSPPPLHASDSNCSTPTHMSPPQCYSPTTTIPPAYVHPPPYRHSSTLPPPHAAPTAFNGCGALRSSLRQPGSLPRQHSVNSVASSNSSNSSSGNTIYAAAPPYLAELQSLPLPLASPAPHRKVNFQEPPVSPKKVKKISFNLPEPAPALPKKPQPPKRSDTTRLTSPKKLANSNSAPPTDFLKDLQRVMRKKWQVAQKCKLEPSTTPHEVLGFRDPPPPVADYRETNVSNWVQEHYGHNNLYENVYQRTGAILPPADQVAEYATSPVHTPKSSEQLRSKRPPPPPPKRSETTHLTSGKLH